MNLGIATICSRHHSPGFGSSKGKYIPNEIAQTYHWTGDSFSADNNKTKLSKEEIAKKIINYKEAGLINYDKRSGLEVIEAKYNYKTGEYEYNDPYLRKLYMIDHHLNENEDIEPYCPTFEGIFRVGDTAILYRKVHVIKAIFSFVDSNDIFVDYGGKDDKDNLRDEYNGCTTIKKFKRSDFSYLKKYNTERERKLIRKRMDENLCEITKARNYQFGTSTLTRMVIDGKIYYRY